MKFSNGRVKAFYSADQREREAIRQDVLVERYTDLQQEMEDIESLLNISEEERDETLFDINEMLFDLLESLVPELVEEEEEVSVEESNQDEIEEAPDASAQLAARQQARAVKIKQRERQSMAIAKNTEKLKRAKSGIVTARIAMRGAHSPDAKAKAREKLRNARQHLATTGIKAGTAK